MVQGKLHHSGKTLLMSILNRALKDAGFSDIEVTHGNVPEYFERMTLESARTLTPEIFGKKIELVEVTRRLRSEPNEGEKPAT